MFLARTHAEPFDHLGLFRDRRTAERVARVLHGVGELPIIAVPVWLEFAGVALAKRLGRPPLEGQLFVVDRDKNPSVRAEAASAAELASSLAGGAEEST